MLKGILFINKYANILTNFNLTNLIKRSLIGSILVSLISIFRYFLKTRFLRKIDVKKISLTKNNISFFSYFINIEQKKLANKVFLSNHWGEIPKLFKKNKKPINWFHIYIEDRNKSKAQIVNEINQLNESSKDKHLFLENFYLLH